MIYHSPARLAIATAYGVYHTLPDGIRSRPIKSQTILNLSPAETSSLIIAHLAVAAQV